VVLQIKLLELGPLGPLDSRHETLGATFKLYHQVSKKPLKSPHYIYISELIADRTFKIEY
jgi:hypothetical protein